jgi:hypothetical protein
MATNWATKSPVKTTVNSGKRQALGFLGGGGKLSKSFDLHEFVEL